MFNSTVAADVLSANISRPVRDIDWDPPVLFDPRSSAATPSRGPLIAELTVQDVQKRFPTASMEEIEEFVRLQQQNIALLSQIRQKRSEYCRAIRNNMGEVVFTHTAGSPRTIQENGKFIVENYAGSNLIKIDCKTKENVHIRNCRGVDGTLNIKVDGLTSNLYVENCTGIRVLVEAILFSGAAVECSNIDLVIGAELPGFLLRNIRGASLTFCPDNIDGAIESVNCSEVSLHCVFRNGFLTLNTHDLVNASAKYIATLPSTVCTRIIRTRGEANAVVKHEARARGSIENDIEIEWKKRMKGKLSQEVYGL
ncbi:hypothetical protein GUITHDRAFT_109392 [Guillardia theta CCMP2712]|uniref:Adenylate cyclase-associated CAP C-terminal domain-containing protein n=1 Tax=Guillardia theta (strain CCMP2712) TaxID=905079 RepID=L1J7W0_GUITC|nr:hypothetical protein GUITHDRAFT_109392 [Guillardia theta CCMP2712]EKX44616.1 hypothetical protein GUITHDRAFT_109392 [Guillardia theta CCMP2712]|eukprot:XP_005831596.1 hypothetical protein GUITHDRAFT_109392 [Guillardia theta CCMP2712]